MTFTGDLYIVVVLSFFFTVTLIVLSYNQYVKKFSLTFMTGNM